MHTYTSQYVFVTFYKKCTSLRIINSPKSP